MSITRRRFCQSLGGGGILSLASVARTDVPALMQGSATAQSPSHLGNLYPFVQQQAERSSMELSFLQLGFRELPSWQKTARARVLEHLFYSPPPISPKPDVIRRTDRGDYIEEYLTFQTTPDLRVPGYVLLPKKATFPAPGMVVLHCHGGAYVWGKEKVVAPENEHPVLSEFKQRLIKGRSSLRSQSEMKPNADVRDVVLEELPVRRRTVIKLQHERDESSRVTARPRA